MSELKEWFNSVVLSLSAFGVMVNGLWNTYITQKIRREAREAVSDSKVSRARIAEKLDAVKENTDGLTEHLVRKAEEVGHAAGLKAGEERGAATAATLAEGRQLGRDESSKP